MSALLKMLFEALVVAFIKQIPTIMGMLERRRANQDQQAKDARNEQAIADALQPKAETPEPKAP